MKKYNMWIFDFIHFKKMSISKEFHKVLNLDTDRFTKCILVKDVFDSSPAEDKIQEFGWP